MDDNLFPSENQINNKELNEIKNEQTMNKLKLRKNMMNNILNRKNRMKQDNEIENKVFDELGNLNYIKLHEEIKRIFDSNNEQNIYKCLNYIYTEICPKSFNDKTKSEMARCGITNIILNLFYTNSNKSIFPLCCAILSSFCNSYFEFSTQLINEDGIKIIYDKLTKNFSDDINVVSLCVLIYNDSLDHLIDQIKNKNSKYSDLSYNTKRFLCHFANWILCEKKIFSSFETNTYLNFFKLLKLLKTSVSVPNQYELDFEQGNGAVDNLFSYVLEQSVKDLEYFALENYLEFIILLSRNKKYIEYLTHGNRTIFDVIKRLCGYLYLNQNSTKEERDNFPMLEPFMLGYCFEIMSNMPLEVAKRDDIMALISTLFYNYRTSIGSSDVPINIMDLMVSFSENVGNDQNIAKLLLSPGSKVIVTCIKIYIRNKICYVKVLQFLINIFEFNNFNQLDNVKFENVIKCISNGLEHEEREINSKSVYCLKKIIEINARRKYNLDLVRYFEENQVLEKLNNLVLNKNYENISEDESADDLIAYVKEMIKKDENK